MSLQVNWGASSWTAAHRQLTRCSPAVLSSPTCTEPSPPGCCCSDPALPAEHPPASASPPCWQEAVGLGDPKPLLPPWPHRARPQAAGCRPHRSAGLFVAMALRGKGAGAGRGQQGFCFSLGTTANGHSVAKPPGGGCSWADDGNPHHPHPKA